LKIATKNKMQMGAKLGRTRKKKTKQKKEEGGKRLSNSVGTLFFLPPAARGPMVPA
jgi:hypothetical protein